jgi:hypothetical protein
MPGPSADPPRRLTAGAGGVEYELRSDLVAVHGGAAESASPSVEDLGGGVRVHRSGEAPGGETGPVYALAGGTLAVPTGRVLVRFREGVDAAGRADELGRAGFRVEEALSYAPHAAWVAAVAGGIVGALHGVEALRALPEVEHVEPQMLTGRQTRG